ncbi:10181_t:CDS:2 [Dentiscutata heterogama]|uniref:10181_t:CDS:1 n=1 Tax=Dentiscutata heterogama TaxID=1316150 RepID=A0ACA9MY60_9GLOM|nr:10181_t:CDS:2 [Dentiscutata heterogama]
MALLIWMWAHSAGLQRNISLRKLSMKRMEPNGANEINEEPNRAPMESQWESMVPIEKS